MFVGRKSRAAQRSMLLRDTPSHISNVSTVGDIPLSPKEPLSVTENIVKKFLCINFPCSTFVSCLILSLCTSEENPVPSFLRPLLSWL